MKLELEPTSQIVTINGNVPARIWLGKTDAGVSIQALIVRVACPIEESEENERLSQALVETAVPCPEPRAFDMRFVL